MSNNTPKILRNSILIVFIVVLISYAIYNSRILIAGPQINVSEPQNGSTITDSPLIRVKGTASNIAFIDINDRTINVDENSVFNEPVILYPGHNTIKISAKDKFDREIEKILGIIYLPQNDDLSLPEVEEKVEGVEEGIERVEENEENGGIFDSSETLENFDTIIEAIEPTSSSSSSSEEL